MDARAKVMEPTGARGSGNSQDAIPLWTRSAGGSHAREAHPARLFKYLGQFSGDLHQRQFGLLACKVRV